MTEEPDWKLEAEKIDVHGADARDWADALFAAYALGKSHATEWRPIAEAPRDGTPVLVGRTGEVWIASRRDPPLGSSRDGMPTTGYDFTSGPSRTYFPPTHYMPLPPAPETKE